MGEIKGCGVGFDFLWVCGGAKEGVSSDRLT